MRMYLNGHEVANWNSVCAPDPEGTFILGMDLSDEMYPKEFFDGLLDEVSATFLVELFLKALSCIDYLLHGNVKTPTVWGSDLCLMRFGRWWCTTVSWATPRSRR